jgi:hypothetical protein
MRNITAKCNKTEILETLRKNLENHKKIVKEAREGFTTKAKKLLDENLDLLAKGKLSRLNISLSNPKDHSAEYNTVIKALELHVEKTIELNTEEVRNFIEDKWDWTRGFLIGNSMYSDTATKMSQQLEENY